MVIVKLSVETVELSLEIVYLSSIDIAAGHSVQYLTFAAFIHECA